MPQLVEVKGEVSTTPDANSPPQLSEAHRFLVESFQNLNSQGMRDRFKQLGLDSVEIR